MSSATWALHHFGDQLLTNAGNKSTLEVLRGKPFIGIYFSAHWCPPCRGFTPVLAEFYNIYKEEIGENFEIVFVSSDRDASSFQEYYGSMPWTALPFEARDRKQSLCETFGVRGIPTFIVVDPETGKVIDADGRNTVQNSHGNAKDVSSKWSK
jgi:nucleoredoxin